MPLLEKTNHSTGEFMASIAERISNKGLVVENPNRNNSVLKQTAVWMGGKGPGHVSGFAKKAFSSAADYCRAHQDPLNGIFFSSTKDKAGVFKDTLGLFRFPQIAIDVSDATDGLCANPSISTGLAFTSNVADAFASTVGSCMFLAKNYVPLPLQLWAGRVGDFGSFVDITIAWRNFQTLNVVSGQVVLDAAAAKDVKQAVADSRMLALFELIKQVTAVASIALSAIATASFMLQISAASGAMMAVALSITPVVGATLTIVSYFYKESSQYKPLNADKIAELIV